jgi:Raf kinase inhibitor-like YbhB/YbcL family protein
MKTLGFVALLTLATTVGAQNPPQQQSGTPQQTPAPGGRQGGRGRGVAVMTMSTSAWTDGGVVPAKYAQSGDEYSPPLTWSDPPEGTQSFLLVVHDIDATNADGTLDTLHWMVWNIPPSSRGLPEHMPQGPELPDGSRQISASGPYYRGPAAPPTGPEHHYVFDLYALDTKLDVPSVSVPVAPTRVAIVAAMAGHVRGKASLVGRFKY